MARWSRAETGALPRSRETAHYTAAGRTGSRKGEGKHVENSTDHAPRMGGNTPRLQGNHNDPCLPALRRLDFPVAARPVPRRMHRREWARMDRAQAKNDAQPGRAGKNGLGIRGGGRTCLTPTTPATEAAVK